MTSQLGNIVFESVFGFESLETKGSVNYAQHNLINVKPVLQPTGRNLDEITAGIRLRADFINVAAAILSLQQSRDEYEVLPLVKGNGQYLGDYVITEITITETQTFTDGTIADASLSLVLLEYVTADKLQQQQASARRQAFATGNNTPFALNVQQQPTLAQTAAGDLSAVNAQANVINTQAAQWENNIPQRPNLQNKIQAGLQKIDRSLQDFENRINQVTILDDIAQIIAAVQTVKNTITGFIIPITSINDLRINNRDLQGSIRALNTINTQLFNLVITRRA